MLQWRIGIFYGGATVAGENVSNDPAMWMIADLRSGAFSGLLAFGISFMAGTDGMLGWSWIFVRFQLHVSLL